MKKNFKTTAENAQPVYTTIIGAASEDHEAQEAREVQEMSSEQKALQGLRTRGRKGEKLVHFNMSFTAENMDYIRTMSKIKGQTMTQFVNVIIATERDRNGKIYDAAKEILKNL